MTHLRRELSWHKCFYMLGFSLMITLCFEVAGADVPCALWKVGESGVCVCNATYCDTVSRTRPQPGGFVAYTSSASGLRFKKTFGELISSEIDPRCMTSLVLDPSVTYQELAGFGGAFTDSAGINWMSLKDPAARQNLVDSYFSVRGIEYNMGRVPMGGTDFSTHPYAYDVPVGDAGVEVFSLAEEDYKYKIPFIRAAMEVATEPVLIVASIWSPPAWMKNCNSLTIGYLLKEFYQTLANYFCRFLESYKESGVRIWAVTTTNEPINGVMLPDKMNRLQWTIPDLGRWIAKFLGPTMRNSTCEDVKIIVGDDQRSMIPFWLNFLIQVTPEASDYIDGVGVHFYFDKFTPASQLTDAMKDYPDKFLLYTEAAEGVGVDPDKRVDLGNWERAESYALNIVEDLNHRVIGWIDWNMCLNTSGGPTWTGNRIDSPIIVSEEAQEFYKQPMFYALGHFSKFLRRGSRRLRVKARGCHTPPHVAFLTPENTLVLVVVNTGMETDILMRVGENIAILKIEERSFVTVEVPYPDGYFSYPDDECLCEVDYCDDNAKR